uniref:Uncharacterized protein n=1 Tax=Gorilla gorilla gorilla TaxID=9595 RepID=G3S2B1_GORGO
LRDMWGGKRRRGLHPFIPSLGPVFKFNLTATVAQSGERKRLGKVGEQTLGDENPREEVFWVGVGGGGSWFQCTESLGPLTLQHGNLGVDLLLFPSRQKLSFALSGPALGKGVGVNEQLF